jgi:hypothetical protein
MNNSSAFAKATTDKPVFDEDVVNKDIGSSKDLIKAIADNKTNSNLFRDEMLFKKMRN